MRQHDRGARLGRPVTRDQVAAAVGGKCGRDQRPGEGNNPVEDDRDFCLRSAEHEPCDRSDLQPAELRQHGRRIGVS